MGPESAFPWPFILHQLLWPALPPHLSKALNSLNPFMFTIKVFGSKEGYILSFCFLLFYLKEVFRVVLHNSIKIEARQSTFSLHRHYCQQLAGMAFDRWDPPFHSHTFFLRCAEGSIFSQRQRGWAETKPERTQMQALCWQEVGPGYRKWDNS